MINKIAIIGGGPAGFYTAHKLLSSSLAKLGGSAASTAASGIEIDILEALPVPFGLVRFGIAPDHPEAKNVEHKFEKVAQSPHVRFWGNVRLGTDIQISELTQMYDAVVFAYGASKDRSLKLSADPPNNGVFGSREFVGWYNGYPTRGNNQSNVNVFERALCSTKSDTAVIIGMGNVALDISRILLSPIDALAKTDISEAALELLRKSTIKRVFMLGRRGPLQVSFTAKELRETLHIPNVRCTTDTELLRSQLDLHSASLSTNRQLKRLMNIFERGILETPLIANKYIQFQFLGSPRRFYGDDDNHVCGMEWTQNTLKPDGSLISDESGKSLNIETNMIVKCIGYELQPIPGLPFDKAASCIPNSQGRVTDPATGKIIEGMYVAGWMKTGPRGTIATTMMHSYETAASVIADISHGVRNQNCVESVGHYGLQKILEKRSVRYITFNEWKLIEMEEIRRGKLVKKPREKFIGIGEMLNFLDKSSI